VTVGPAEWHTVVQAWNPRKREIMTWCSDNFLEGTLPADKARERFAVFDDNPAARKAIEDLWFSKQFADPDAPCDFWKRHAKGEACEHVELIAKTGATPEAIGVAQRLRQVADVANVADMRLLDPEDIQDLCDLWGLGLDGPDDIDAECGDDSGSEAPISWHLTPRGIADKLAFRSPVMLEGDTGAGKTTLARSLAASHDAVLIEVQGHESVEAADLLGHFVPAQNGLVWKDGKLSQAFRMAGAGRKVVLLLDELLRIPRRQLSVLLGALSPYQGQYALSTGRMAEVVDGIGVEEALRCPVENLAVVATTNVGMQYAVDDIDPALAGRFVPIRMETSEDMAQAVLAQACKAKKFAAGVAKKLVTFLAKTTELRDNRQITGRPSLGVLVRCVNDADSEADVAHLVRTHHLLWVGRGANGEPDSSELDALEKITKRVFKD
jgi:MoxR-like ATPase